MRRFLSTAGLASRCARRPWTTIVIWLLVAGLGAFAVVQLLGGALTNEMQFTNQPDSQRGLDLLQNRLTGPQKFNEIVIVSSSSLTVDDPAFGRQVAVIGGRIAALGPGVINGAISYYQTHDPSMVSKDRHSTIILAQMAGTLDQAEKNVGKLEAVDRQVSAASGMGVMSTGYASTNQDFNTAAQADGRRTETVGVILALIILVVVFGTMVAAGLPVALAGFSIIIALGITAVVSQKYQMSIFAANMISMMGLAVGIDYTLFVLSRFREEMSRGLDKYEAIAVAGATASKAVLFSGMTVILALVGMLMVPISLFASLGAGAIFVVAVAVAAALTLLPAILSLLGERVNAVRIPFVHRVSGSESGRFWTWIADRVMRRPLLAALAVFVILAVPATFYFQMKTGSSGIGALPDSFESKQAYLKLGQEFSTGLLSPLEIVVDGDLNSAGVRQGIARLTDELKKDPAYYGRPQLQRNSAGNLAMVSQPISAPANSQEAADTVEKLRQDYIPAAFRGSGATVLVTGEPAMNADYFSVTDTYRPFVFAFVLGLSFLLLMIVFRSLVVPLKAILMNLLSVGAAYGLIVIVFQKGVGAALFGFGQVDAIDAWIPLFLFSVLFGLSMDYHVFLLGRIREHYLETGDNSAAVAFGLKSTGRIITGAALIMVAVFSGFASGQLIMFQQMGFGLAVAVLLDATLIRSVLVPATMKLLGHWNWYLPGWLKWLPDVRLGERHDGSANGGAE